MDWLSADVLVVVRGRDEWSMVRQRLFSAYDPAGEFLDRHWVDDAFTRDVLLPGAPLAGILRGTWPGTAPGAFSWTTKHVVR